MSNCLHRLTDLQFFNNFISELLQFHLLKQLLQMEQLTVVVRVHFCRVREIVLRGNDFLNSELPSTTVAITDSVPDKHTHTILLCHFVVLLAKTFSGVTERSHIVT
jgi:hypothetical protein